MGPWAELKRKLHALFRRRSPVGAGRKGGGWSSAARPASQGQEAAPEPLLEGRYRLEHIIGRGGMGKVWKAREVESGRRVAVKEMRKGVGALDSDIRATFLKESKVLEKLRHPNIVEFISMIERGKGVFLIFEFIRGKTLHQLIAEKRRLSWTEMRHILRAAARGLEYAHGKGVIHRDLKPANLMISVEGFTKIMDFGISRISGQELPVPEGRFAEAAPGDFPVARTPNLVGTPAYRAPEASEGIVSPAADVFSLGVCLYESLTGTLPFGSSGCALAGTPRPEPVSRKGEGVPESVDRLIEQMLEPDYKKRIPSMSELRKTIRKSP